MYIKEVLRRCDVLCPNEYTDEEKYMWCDELSAMLTQEYVKKYESVEIEPTEDGSYLLPEGIAYEMIDRIFDGNREIDKVDFRSYGVEYLYDKDRRFAVPTAESGGGKIRVVYLKQYEEIRTANVEFSTLLNADGFNTTQGNMDDIKAGDTINIKIDYESIDGVPVFGIDMSDDGSCDVRLSDGVFADYAGQTKNLKLERVVTDETMCSAPYDSMYVDFVMAKICFYQRDFDTYNQHMNVFNSKIQSYARWLQARRTTDKDGKIINWWE